MKSINEIAVKLSHAMIKGMREVPKEAKMLLDLILHLILKFPMAKQEIIGLITKNMPHAMMPVQMHSIYIKLLFYFIEKLPAFEEELLAIIISRFCQIDVNVKSKQLANKRHFTSDDLKADVYLYYLIHHFKARIHQIETQDEVGSSFTKDAKMQDENDDDSILDSSDDEDTKENSIVLKKHKLENFLDLLIRLFENNVLPFSELHYPQYCFLYVASLNQLFLQKMVTLFILKAFSKSAHINIKTH